MKQVESQVIESMRDAGTNAHAIIAELAAVNTVCARLYTSTKRILVKGQRREFCFLLNHAIRSDDPKLLHHALPLVECINRHIVGELRETNAPFKLPPTLSTMPGCNGHRVTYRGGGMTAACQYFFQEGVRYRTDQYTSTSFDEDIALTFASRSKCSEKVMWRYHVPTMCANVNYLSKTTIQEQEFLFVPFSVFSVLSVSWSNNVGTTPHYVDIQACADNKTEPAWLPIAPRC